MTKDFEINDILSAVNSISKMKNKKGTILETKNDTFNKEDAINKNNQVKSDKSEILVLSQMIEQYSINYYRKLNDYQNAINCYERAIKIKNNHAGAHHNLAAAHKEMGNFEESIKYINYIQIRYTR